MKRRLKDAVSNPRDYLEMTADENQNEWRRDPNERSLGFFNPVPLGKVDPFLLRKQMKAAIDEIPSLSRRDFMKKSAGLAAGSTVGAGVTAKLLRKFAPEERAVTKEAVAEAAPKYKYNSLKEYLDDVTAHAEDRATGYSNTYGGSWKDYHPDYMKERLLSDELAYKTAKENGAFGGKIMGAGGGGFFLLNCEKNAPKMIRTLNDNGLKNVPFNFDHVGSKVILDL